MLIDIFARRYEGAILRSEFDERDARVLVQAFRILSEDMYPYFINGKTSEYAVTFWTNLHKRLSRELGLTELSPQWFHYTTKWNGQETAQTHKKPLVTVCEEWMLKPVSGLPDQHLKDRLSLIELGFRERENEIATMLAQPETNALQALAATSTLRVPGSPKSAALSYREGKVAAFRTCVDELNARFRHAALPLNYHNGFIQIATDDLVQREVETPFWTVVSGPEWANVDLDMKQALDLRDSDGRDPAFYAARALESTIKIISDRKGWTHGKENGAHNYIDNLASKKHGFVTPWEGSNLKDFFTHVRNPFGHGAGSAQMPSLSRAQTEWAIEFSMSWIKSLIRRL